MGYEEIRRDKVELLLTEEEIQAIIDELRMHKSFGKYEPAQTMCKAQLKKVVEWLGEKNKIDALKKVLRAGHTAFVSGGAYINSKDWQALKKESE